MHALFFDCSSNCDFRFMLSSVFFFQYLFSGCFSNCPHLPLFQVSFQQISLLHFPFNSHVFAFLLSPLFFYVYASILPVQLYLIFSQHFFHIFSFSVDTVPSFMIYFLSRSLHSHYYFFSYKFFLQKYFSCNLYQSFLSRAECRFAV